LTLADRTAIQNAADNAELMAIEALGALSNMRSQRGTARQRKERRQQAWRSNANIVRWFGTDHLSNAQMKNTHRRIRRIRDHFTRTMKFDLIHHDSGFRSWLCRPNAVAYTSPGTPIKICPRFFTVDSLIQARTIIHELAHKTGHTRHHHGAADPASALQLAQTNCRAARHNPENFGAFCAEYFGLTRG
jgi:hypothetical protein